MNDSPSKPIDLLKNHKSQIHTKTIQMLILVFVTLQLIGEIFGNSHLMLIKPVPIILMILMSFYSLECDPQITFALIFGLMGDLCLMFPTMLLFEVGAVFFLIGHICYIRSFTKNYNISRLSFEFLKITPHLASCMIFTILILNSFILWKHLPNKGLFVLYGIILSLMCSSSFYRDQQKGLNKYWLGIMGAIAFMASDYLIAYSKFMGNNINGFFIILLYYAGQFMILKGNSKQKISEQKSRKSTSKIGIQLFN